MEKGSSVAQKSHVMRDNRHKLKGKAQNGYKKELFHYKGSQAAEQAAQRGCVVSLESWRYSRLTG